MQDVKSGALTSEKAVRDSANTWAIVAMVLGAITTYGAQVASVFGAESKLAIIGGVVVAVAGITMKMFVDLGYIKSRADVKKAAAE